MIALVAFVIIIAMFAMSMGILDLFFAKKRANRARVGKRLTALNQNVSTGEQVNIERTRSLSDVDWLNRALKQQSWSQRLDNILEQAQVRVNVSTLVLTSLVGATTALFITQAMTENFFIRLIPTAIFFYAPFFWVRRRKAKRMHKFNAQLADALDLIARALKAGHAFSQGMRMVADEFEDPIGPEFSKTLDEINFGISVGQALLNLTQRVDCTDLKFFVVSVNIQRETGGNLSEIVGNIARLVRERFRFAGKVQVLAAEGKLTAYILLSLPFAIGFAITAINPDYMSEMHTTEAGRNLITGALILMGCGAAVLKKLITIRV
ncbi:type II secretion system F family protein [Desulfovibrio ferrophilus]|uniref:Bacterial type II secretion system F domain protein n=1 Tax=Desulfovibrio ferrophilus TaxID=241368 RepID=A0A2Z6AY73_9BACT|nr:type II secretion system F family protein [Desulfovibrio ferrophilus]BBD08125.1 bacterial type II secretion system F domain protein [Desulfovibrio ferrophilus]